MNALKRMLLAALAVSCAGPSARADAPGADA
jgi:hypothetical protein